MARSQRTPSPSGRQTVVQGRLRAMQTHRLRPTWTLCLGPGRRLYGEPIRETRWVHRVCKSLGHTWRMRIWIPSSLMCTTMWYVWHCRLLRNQVAKGCPPVFLKWCPAHRPPSLRWVGTAHQRPHTSHASPVVDTCQRLPTRLLTPADTYRVK